MNTENTTYVAVKVEQKIVEVNIMVDLETTGTWTNAGILSIGATTFFTPELVTHSFYDKVSLQSLEELEFSFDKDTMDWWGKQLAATREEAFSGTSKIEETLIEFGTYISNIEKVIEQKFHTEVSIKLWGNGSDFDNVILANAYNKCNLPLPWNFRNNRCYRTLKNLFPQIQAPEEMEVFIHNSYYDASYQAAHATRILAYKSKLVTTTHLVASSY